jgi:predicted alpha-1,6-mannanase (GH76 family)
VTIKTDTTWSSHAACFSETVQECYWNPATCLFESSYPANLEDGVFHYWWQAHTLDSLLDAFERTGQTTCLQRADQLLQGVLKRNGGTIMNSYYDDMQWMALALLRLYDMTKDAKYLEHVQTLWEDIQTGWNEHCDGGIAWRKIQLDYKNTPANAPAVILAARLYQRFRHEHDLEFALKIYNWLQHNLVDPATGFVWDGMNRLGDGQIDKDWAFTYCQGVMMGAGLELYKVTRDTRYLQQGQRTARSGLERLCDAKGILPDEGNGDSGLFKGILVRYLTLVQLEHPDANILQVLRYNVQSLTELQSPLAGSSWQTEPRDSIDLSVALSGVMLLESLAKLEKVGMFSPRCHRIEI